MGRARKIALAAWWAAGFAPRMPTPDLPPADPVFVPLDFQTFPEVEMRARAAEFLADLQRRRTVRDFSPRAVSRAVIEDGLRTAGTAPSGANQQPWHFAVIGREDASLRQRLRAAAEAEEREFYTQRAPAEWREAVAPLGTDASKPFLETAPWLIAIFAAHSREQADGRRQQIYYPKESVGIATGLLIAALHHAGLATLTHTPSPMNFLNELCGRPTSEKPFLLLVVGYPAEGARVPAAASTKKSLAEIATFL